MDDIFLCTDEDPSVLLSILPKLTKHLLHHGFHIKESKVQKSWLENIVILGLIRHGDKAFVWCLLTIL